MNLNQNDNTFDSKDPLVSVNLVTRDRCSLLIRSIQSVFSQSYKNIELVVVDDGSQDSTWETLTNLTSSYDRLIPIKLANSKGSATARNVAFANSNGNIIAFMDDDDVWIDDKKILKQVDLLLADDNNSSSNILIATGIRIVDSDKTIDWIGKLPEDPGHGLLMGNGFIYCPTVVTTRALMEISKGFDEKLMRGDDSDFYRRCFFWYHARIVLLPDITTEVHVNSPARQSAPSDIDSFSQHLDFASQTIKKFKKQLSNDSEANAYWQDVSARRARQLLFLSCETRYYMLMIAHAFFAFRNKPSIRRLVNFLLYLPSVPLFLKFINLRFLIKKP